MSSNIQAKFTSKNVSVAMLKLLKCMKKRNTTTGVSMIIPSSLKQQEKRHYVVHGSKAIDMEFVSIYKSYFCDISNTHVIGISNV